MPNPWSREEVEAAVADYLHMWLLEQAWQAYNRTTHRKQLNGSATIFPRSPKIMALIVLGLQDLVAVAGRLQLQRLFAQSQVKSCYSRLDSRFLEIHRLMGTQH